MWYLVIPPIIVVLSLSFLLWYLSRKGADPTIAEQLSQSEEEKPSFSRTRSFFLRILEKWASRFKVASLRTHNALNEFTQSVKESRRKIQDSIEESILPEKKESPETPTEENPIVFHTPPAEEIQEEMPQVQEVLQEEVKEERGGFFSRLRKKVQGKKESLEEKATQREDGAKDEGMLDQPFSRHRKHEEQIPSLPVSANEEATPRPMVSETVAEPEPEIRKKRLKPNVSREETLIARIAVNPKDFTAYEELGDYYFETENIKDAKECYRQVLKLSPVNRMVKIKIRRLEKLLTRDGE